MTVDSAQIQLADLLTGRTPESQPWVASGDCGADPQVKPQLAA